MDDGGSDGMPNGQDQDARSLDARLKAARDREGSRSKAPAGDDASASYRAGNRVLADLVGGIVGGLFLGWVIDQFAGTRPWGMLVMMFLGIFVAFRNIIRNAGQSGD